MKFKIWIGAETVADMNFNLPNPQQCTRRKADVASSAKFIVSRDKHLFNLMNLPKPGIQAFQSQFPDLSVL